MQKRGEAIAGQRLARAKSEIKSLLAEELPGDVRVTETGEGVQVEGRRLKQRLIGNSSLRDVAFLMRAVR
ncbi:hypothetical protein C8024_00815 [Sphingopyxis sp. BSNA05]|uniref:hypothetical protein n=1 Tax=Sphingopyxis sp. BSNA05 TaxID=1236614 RepID=UPI0015666B87|nr:hypothetical protein [Sphingopyxis sp. BSNA05]NRD88311.1 hypothetical protein [Sphingopyxis sp. BSNA05]